MSTADPSAALAGLKQRPETAWLNAVATVPTQQALRHLDRAFRQTRALPGFDARFTLGLEGDRISELSGEQQQTRYQAHAEPTAGVAQASDGERAVADQDQLPVRLPPSDQTHEQLDVVGDRVMG